MAEISGKNGAVYYTDTGTNGDVVVINGIRDFTINYEGEALEVTDFGDSGEKAYIAGLKGWRGTFNGFKDGAPVDCPQEITVLQLRESTNTTQRYSGSAILTNYSESVAVDGAVEVTYEFLGKGVLTLPTA